jgi:hypothetical protein
MTARPHFRAVLSATLALATLSACAEAPLLNPTVAAPANTAGAAPGATTAASAENASYAVVAKLNGVPFANANVKIFLGASTVPLLTGTTASDGSFSTDLGPSVKGGMPIRVVISKDHNTLAALTRAQPVPAATAGTPAQAKFHVMAERHFGEINESSTAAYAVFRSEFMRLNHLHDASDDLIWGAYFVFYVGFEKALANEMSVELTSDPDMTKSQVASSLDENGLGTLNVQAGKKLDAKPAVHAALQLVGAWTEDDIKAGLDKGAKLNDTTPPMPITLGDTNIAVVVDAIPTGMIPGSQTPTVPVNQNTATVPTVSANGGGTGGGGSGGVITAASNPLINVSGNLVQPTFVAPPAGPPALTCLTTNTLGAPATLDYGLRTSIAGNFFYPGFQDGVGAAARFAQPRYFDRDANGTIYVGDVGNNAIRRISNPAGLVDTFATTADIGRLSGMAASDNGMVYVSDPVAHKIRQIDRCTGAVTTLAGSGLPGYSDSSTGLSATFDSPSLMAVDRAGTKLFITEYGQTPRIGLSAGPMEFRIRMIDLVSSNHPVTTFIASHFHLPNTPSVLENIQGFTGIAVDSHGDVLFMPSPGYLLVKVDPSGLRTDVAGSFNNSPTVPTDGTGAAAIIGNSCSNLTIDNADNVYFLDSQAIRKVTPAGVVTTLATTGVAISGWTIDAFGVLYGSVGNNIVKTAL